MTIDFRDENLAREFGRNLTEEIAPLESEFYDELIDARGRPSKAPKDRALAFGVSPTGALAVVLFEVGKVVLQAIWTVAQPALTNLAKDAADQLQTDLSKKVKDWIDSKFKAPLPIQLSADAARSIVEAARK